MPSAHIHGVLVATLIATQAMGLSGCSLRPSPSTAVTDAPYCLRAGDNQAFDCTAPALPVRDVRDPLAPATQVNDEELMTLLAEIKRWLAHRKLTLQGHTLPPEPAPATATPVASPTASPSLPRPWLLILDDFSPQSLQRTNSRPAP
ncbi:MAG: hypothetical protein GYB41_10865 [Oceanospirillales bacterium]|nr:hypothetical protein [Oceanospirillales bacterium]